ncbi:MAG TPA: hypothetical protein VMS56_04020 [Thermoanaerobaculia bacterium]|nr:hypothetical protein [Thermoanaerobaculia bacterium]
MNLSPRLTPAAAAAVALALTAGMLLLQGAHRGPFRIDEAHKISETVFLRLLLEGRVSDPLWLAHVVDRTNPPAGKYLLGAGIALQGGRLPDAPPLSHESLDGSIPPTHPAESSAPYAPLLRKGRIAAIAATSLAAAILAWTLAKGFGAGAAAAGILLFATSFPVAGWGGTAIFDPFLALMFLAPLPLLLGLGRASTGRGLWWRACAAGALAALAFQIRMSGLVVLGAVLVVAALAMRREPRRLAAWSILASITFLTTAVAMNPYYWAAAAGPSATEGSRILPARILARFAGQLGELGMLLDRVRSGTDDLRGPVAKLGYLAEIAFGDLSGIALMAGIVAAIALAPLTWRSTAAEGRSALVYAAAIALPYLAWLPLAWPRYVLPLMPALALLGGAGWGWAVARARAGLAQRREPA